MAVVIESPDGVAVDVEELRKWIGRTESYTDHVMPTPIAALAATLDRDDPTPKTGDPIPPLWHWLYFLPIHRASELAPDGHASRGGFLPPVPLPRRMFAGGRYRFEHPLRVGDTMTRVSRVMDVTVKSGRTGPLVFVVVRHEISNSSGLAVVEEHDIVYRDEARRGSTVSRGSSAATGAPVSSVSAAASASPVSSSPPSSGPVLDEPTWRQEVRADEVTLFRYSALTFNGHRIHYDRRYATEVEGYPGLVVHGPFIATMLLELVRRSIPGTMVAEFQFRAISPLFDDAPFFVCARRGNDRSVRVWATNAQGTLTADGSVTLAS
jgi:3-methylfumaryl-CoA hydratase